MDLQADGPAVIVRYDWQVDARKPLLRALTWLLRPIFTANHKWAMRKGEESLKLELARRHVANVAFADDLLKRSRRSSGGNGRPWRWNCGDVRR